MTVKSFQIRVADDVLSDLRSRLVRTRFTEASDTEFWAAGKDIEMPTPATISGGTRVA